MEEIKFTWKNSHSSLSAEESLLFNSKFQSLLDDWEGTPFMLGQRVKGVAVDCVNFVAAVLDEITGQKTSIASLPTDSCFHDPKRTYSAFRSFLCKYLHTEVTPFDGVYHLEPGDIIVCGPKDGGPGHGMVVGVEKNVLYHCDHLSVTRTGCSFGEKKNSVYCFKKVYRLSGKKAFLDTKQLKGN